MARSPDVVPVGAASAAVLDVACRLAESGSAVASEITQAAAAVAPELASLPPDYLRSAITRLITAPYASDGLQWLHDAGVLAALIPDLDATVNFSQEAGRRHKDVWEHTKQVVMQSSNQPIVRWAALLHDIGKVSTRIMLPDGKVTFHRHAEVGARMFDTLGRRLGFPRPERQRIRFLIVNHLRANAYEPEWTDAAVRRFDHEMGDALPELVELSRADVTSARPGRRQEAGRNIDALLQRIAAVRELDARVPPLPPGVGNAIMEAFAIPPSRRVGELRKLCEDAIERGELQERQPSEYYVDYLRKQGLAGEPRDSQETP
jgi:poly(A) polymerase